MKTIFELPSGVINQIAAGEVIERPASVLKELLENSLDSGARRLSVVIDGAGSDLVRVQDDGSGICREDLPGAFLRHATSKIRSYDDLVSTKTLGFRGEALASVASVSRITIETRASDEVVGSRMFLDPEKSPEITDWAGPVGTTIAIRDLFFNVPVRKKYLKSPQTEQGHMIDTLNRLAMGFHQCQFDLATTSRKLVSLVPRSSPALRLLDLYPGFAEEDLVCALKESANQKVTVFLLRPDKVRRDRQYQHLFINQRWVRHPGLFEAMTQGAAGKLSRDVHVGAWVYLELPPQQLDVNVHPTKREVRLLEGDRLFSLVRRVVEDSFAIFDLRNGSSMDVSERILRNEDPVPTSETHEGKEKWVLRDSIITETGGDYPAEHSRTVAVKEGEADLLLGASTNDPALSRFASDPVHGTRGSGTGFQGETREKWQGKSLATSNLPELLKGLPSAFTNKGTLHEPLTVIGQLAGTYLILSWGNDLGIVDWHTAHERLRYEKYRRELLAGGVSKNPILFPLMYKVSLSVADSLDNRLEELSQIGFDLDRTGPDSFRIRAIPRILKDEDPVGILNELGEISGNFEFPVLRSDRIDHALMTLSCHESIRRNDVLEAADGERLVKELLETEHPYTCPHGRPTIMKLGREILDQWFGR